MLWGHQRDEGNNLLNDNFCYGDIREMRETIYLKTTFVIVTSER